MDREHTTQGTVPESVRADLRAVQDHARRTGQRGRFEVRRDAEGRRRVVPAPASRTISPAASVDLATRRRRLDELGREDLAERSRRIGQLERDLGRQ
jgi:hypothetical protein